MRCEKGGDACPTHSSAPCVGVGVSGEGRGGGEGYRNPRNVKETIKKTFNFLGRSLSSIVYGTVSWLKLSSVNVFEW